MLVEHYGWPWLMQFKKPMQHNGDVLAPHLANRASGYAIDAAFWDKHAAVCEYLEIPRPREKRKRRSRAQMKVAEAEPRQSRSLLQP